MKKLVAPLLAGAIALSGVMAAEGHHAPVTQSGPDVPLKAAAKKRTKLVLKDSRFGPVLFDGRNRVLYLFTKDGRGASRCYGACAVAWPPFFKRGRLVAGAGVDGSLLGSVKRGARRQVTYAGKPLYYYEHDGPGDILCHNVAEFGGLWYVVDKNGEPGPP